MAKKKQRLDKLLVERGLVPTRARGRALIMAGEVLVNGQREYRPGVGISDDTDVRLKKPMPYVGRGGYKLAGALQQFGINIDGRTCADVGACTGGFTDVMLQKGATKVYAIDVGYGQLDWKLRQDGRVIVMERTNARYLETLGEPVTFVSIDVSFISLKLILPAVQKWLASEADIVALIKPQFEAGRKEVGKGGIVRDPAVHRQVLTDFLNWSQKQGLTPIKVTRSSIKGSEGNVEFFAWLRPGAVGMSEMEAEIERVIGESA